MSNVVDPALLTAALAVKRVGPRKINVIAARMNCGADTLRAYCEGKRRLSVEMYRRALMALRLKPDWKPRPRRVVLP